ncbi:class I SAM-dependent methyltransferase [Magnetospirillum sp. 15-1]|uniref:class I SAM-dependent methyltransferase n=1 Tax=Magnetospirillum sp. 15-1 TaxID=1979370 RepID=UPI001482A908|nr:class I SAM-dependent methyltransferase [Magnetospirillum sp. 15-1]
MKQYRQLQWTPEMVSRFWDWQSQFPEQYFTYQFARPIVAALSHLFRGKRYILDYGCGTGFLLPELCRLGAKVTGADFSPASVAAANGRHGGLPNFAGIFVLDDLLAKNLTFDAIISVEVVEHLYDEQLEQMFTALSRLLEPGGTLVLTSPNDENLKLNELYCPASDALYHRYQHVRSWTAASLSQAAAAHGFQPVGSFTTDFSLSWRQPYRLARRLVGRLIGRGKDPHLVCVFTRPGQD